MNDIILQCIIVGWVIYLLGFIGGGGTTGDENWAIPFFLVLFFGGITVAAIILYFALRGMGFVP